MRNAEFLQKFFSFEINEGGERRCLELFYLKLFTAQIAHTAPGCYYTLENMSQSGQGRRLV